jgi:hypothetical protein
MRNTMLAAMVLSGTLLASGEASAYFDDSHYWGPPVYPVPYAYGYSYARARCGHYWARPWIVNPCGGRVVRHSHRRHRKQVIDK